MTNALANLVDADLSDQRRGPSQQELRELYRVEGAAERKLA